MRVGAVLSVLAGLILLAVCVSQWNAHTGSNIVQGMSAYNQGDRSTLASLNGESNLNDTARTGIEGFAGLFWIGVGVFLWRKDAAVRTGTAPRRSVPRPRR